MDFNAFEKQLTENEMALFIGVTMAMFSAIESGARTENLLERLSTHQKNFSDRGQNEAANVIQALSVMVSSTRAR